MKFDAVLGLMSRLSPQLFRRARIQNAKLRRILEKTGYDAMRLNKVEYQALCLGNPNARPSAAVPETVVKRLTTGVRHTSVAW